MKSLYAHAQHWRNVHADICCQRTIEASACNGQKFTREYRRGLMQEAQDAAFLSRFFQVALQFWLWPHVWDLEPCDPCVFERGRCTRCHDLVPDDCDYSESVIYRTFRP